MEVRRFYGKRQAMKSPLKKLNTYRFSFFLLGLIGALSLSLAAFSYRVDVSRPGVHQVAEEIQEAGIYTPAMRTMPELPKVETPSTKPSVDPAPRPGPTPEPTPVGTLGGLDSLKPIGLEPDAVDDNFIYRGHAIEHFPVFAGCEDLKTEEERKVCLNKGLAKHIANEFTMPRSWQGFPVNDKVFVRFVIEKDGSVSQIQIIRGLGGEMDREVKRVIERLPRIAPATVNGMPVRMYLELPVRIQNGH